jgi:hypothetical protein
MSVLVLERALQQPHVAENILMAGQISGMIEMRNQAIE